jgi:3-phenylpropionate/trans-cinnamate dioxygenase ferredoxin reductase subunit
MSVHRSASTSSGTERAPVRSAVCAVTSTPVRPPWTGVDARPTQGIRSRTPRGSGLQLRTVVVVGASLAGLRAAEGLRRQGHDGHVVLIGAEAHEPYDRPPLSKQLLAGDLEPDQIALRRAGYDDLDLDLELGVRATHLDVAARVVSVDRGDGVDHAVAFDGLVIATGSTPRLLPGLDPHALPAGMFVLRTLDDALALRAALDHDPKVVVVGAGFIGSEVAATCRLRGLEVTVLEALPAPLVRGLGPVLGAVCGELHRDHGVDLRLGVGVAGFDVGDVDGVERVQRVRLDDGTAIDADVVVVGVGVAPVTQWLDDSGLTIDNGVVCDETLLAAPGIVAAGDVARWPNPLFDGELVRLEHWTNASEQGVAAARRLLHGDGDAPEPFAPVPFVWSDQYDRKIQSAGQFRGDDRMEVVHGSLAERRFVAVFERSGRVVGTLGFSMPAKLMQYRRMIAARASFAEALAYAHANP